MGNEKIEKELEELVALIVETTPSGLINEIRLFGSYNNGNWDPEKSDIDIFVEINRKHREYADHWNSNSYAGSSSVESNALGKFKGEFKDRFQISVINDESMPFLLEYDRGRGPGLGKEMKSGRLLYQNLVNKPVEGFTI